MLAKLSATTLAAVVLIPVLIAMGVQAAVTAVLGAGSPPSTTALTDIPADYLTLYQQAAHTCPGLDWSTLAAIGKIETDHGRSTLPGVTTGENHAGAGGPMQILQPTWDSILARHHIPPGGATPPSRYNPHDAIHAAAHYLCDHGANHGDLPTAIFAYNHANWYVDKVLAQAARYANTPPISPATCSTPQATDQPTGSLDTQAAMAVAFACAQLGEPYVWGGNGEPGFDCSGLTHAAYTNAGITLPRTAQTQYNTGPLLPTGTPHAPGDLIFFGTPTNIRHVGIALSATQIIHAPDTGQTIRIQDYRTLPNYAGATRPSQLAAPK